LGAALDAAAKSGPPIAVLHLLCHGAAAGATFGLAFDGDQGGEASIVDAGRLRQVLAPHAAMVRLIVLAACDSGNSGALGNQLGSVAQALHRAGLAQVVASRYPLSVAGSIKLTESLYASLLGSGEDVAPQSVQSSLIDARKQLARDTSHLDWAVVQLYARAADGEYLRPPQLPVPKPILPPDPSGRTTRTIMALGLALGLIGATGGLAMLRSQKKSPDTTTLVVGTFVHWSVNTDPAGAEVVQLPNNKVLGVTPWRRDQLKGSGTISVELRRQGYMPKKLELDQSADATHELTLELQGLF